MLKAECDVVSIYVPGDQLNAVPVEPIPFKTVIEQYVLQLAVRICVRVVLKPFDKSSPQGAEPLFLRFSLVE